MEPWRRSRSLLHAVFLLLSSLYLSSCASVLDQQYYTLKANPEEARQYLNRRIFFNPFFTDAYLERGHLHFNAHRFRDAIDDFEKVASAKSDCLKCVVSMNTMIGSAFLELGESGQAQERFEKVRALDPKDARGAAGLGLVALKRGNAAVAVDEFSEAICLDPQESSYYGNRGVAHVTVENRKKGLEDYNRAIEMNPRYVQCYINRGSILLDEGRAIEAEKDFSRAMEIDQPSAVLLNSRGYARHLQEKFDEALADYDAALKLDPEMPRALGNRAQLYLQTGRVREAATD